MRKLCICAVLTAGLLAGCLDYRDLDKVSAVGGMAFDNAGGGGAAVTLEVIDRSKSLKDEGLRARMIRAEGESIAAALRDAANQLDFPLYFGNMAIAVLAENFPVDPAVEWLRGNREVRETVYMALAEDAGTLLEGEDVVSFRLRDILDASEETEAVELYRMKETLPFFAVEDEQPALRGVSAVKEGG